MHGAHPEDRNNFRPEALAVIREAALDLRYLYSRGYVEKSSIKLVGDRFQLTSRQRQSLFRAVCAPGLAEKISGFIVSSEEIRGKILLVDGHNVLITVETALAGGVLFRCDDGFIRDISETHGSYRKSENTRNAIEILRNGLCRLTPSEVFCYLDRPLPFSGLLAENMREVLGRNIEVEVVDSPDHVLKSKIAGNKNQIVATSDSPLLNKCSGCFDLAGFLIRRWIPEAWVVEI